MPYLLSPAWPKIDPNLDAPRGNLRFQKLVAGQQPAGISFLRDRILP